MVTSGRLVRGAFFTTGWILAVVVSALATLNHFVLIFILDQPILFIGWTVFNLYACLVLWFPFRQRAQWAWWVSWVLVIAFASIIFFDRQIGPLYLGAAALITVGLLLTASAFFKRTLHSAQG